MKPLKSTYPEIEASVPLLTVYVVKDTGRFMAKCPELDLVTEMDSEESAFQAIVEMIQEYAEDYRKRIKQFSHSPNRAHHRPYVEQILSCKNEWQVKELIDIRYGHVHLR